MKKVLFPLLFVLALGLVACEDDGPIEEGAEELDGNVPVVALHIA